MGGQSQSFGTQVAQDRQLLDQGAEVEKCLSSNKEAFSNWGPKGTSKETDSSTKQQLKKELRQILGITENDPVALDIYGGYRATTVRVERIVGGRELTTDFEISKSGNVARKDYAKAARVSSDLDPLKDPGRLKLSAAETLLPSTEDRTAVPFIKENLSAFSDWSSQNLLRRTDFQTKKELSGDLLKKLGLDEKNTTVSAFTSRAGVSVDIEQTSEGLRSKTSYNVRESGNVERSDLTVTGEVVRVETFESQVKGGVSVVTARQIRDLAAWRILSDEEKGAITRTYRIAAGISRGTDVSLDVQVNQDTAKLSLKAEGNEVMYMEQAIRGEGAGDPVPSVFRFDPRASVPDERVLMVTPRSEVVVKGIEMEELQDYGISFSYPQKSIEFQKSGRKRVDVDVPCNRILVHREGDTLHIDRMDRKADGGSVRSARVSVSPRGQVRQEHGDWLR